MKTYFLRAGWYGALLLLAVVFWLAGWTQVLQSYVPALFSYVFSSIFMVVFPSWFYGSRRQSRTTFGVKTTRFWLGAAVVGLGGTAAGLLAGSTLGAQFGMFLAMWAVDSLLSEREVGYRAERSTANSD